MLSEAEAIVLIKHSHELKTAAETCRENIAKGWISCHVTISFENNRKVTIEEAEAYAKELHQQAFIKSEPARRALIRALETAAKTEGVTGEGRCNLFAGVVGKTLNIPYFKDRVEDPKFANEMYAFVERAVGSSSSGWKKVRPERAQDYAQDYADIGKFVVGVAKNKNPNDHGHIAIVVPSQLEHAINPGNSGPWVRDSAHYLQSYRASSIFGSSVVAPIWAYYEY